MEGGSMNIKLDITFASGRVYTAVHCVTPLTMTVFDLSMIGRYATSDASPVSTLIITNLDIERPVITPIDKAIADARTAKAKR